ncbi:MAG: GDP-D-mannose dehydratase [Parcubacteria group bacterium Gr01-1014_38]|nr:MAG: GDP-D-mannose dehydratase [Parcubacteria group bacterium Gr01-1014_38]
MPDTRSPSRFRRSERSPGNDTMRVLVTGADGFVARHAVSLLQTSRAEVVGSVLNQDDAKDISVPLQRLDITDAAACRAVLRAVEPTHVLHLAAQSNVSWSFAHSEETRRVNVEGTRNLLEACAARVHPPVVVVVGSSEEYGPNDGRPLPELPLVALRPLSPYAESKVEVERLIEAEPRFRAFTVRTRSFPHFGPGQKPGFFTADVASQLAAIAAGDRPPVLRVGNLDVVRDYTDVRDVVRAYTLLLERGVLGEVYNVGSGHGVAIRELLDELIRLAGVRVRVEQDPEKARPTEIPALIGDSAKLRAATGWAPIIPLSQTLQDILAWWRTPERLVAERQAHS